MSETEFKVGDSVKILTIAKGMDCEYHRGQVGKITKCNYGHVTVSFLDGTFCEAYTGESIYKREIELVESKPEFKYNFKKGDKLEVVDESFTNRLTNGMVVTCDSDICTNDDKELVFVILPDGYRSDWFSRRFKLYEPKDKELIEEKTNMENIGIEKVKDFDKKVLVEARKKIEEERKELQIEQATEVLRGLFKEKDSIEDKIEADTKKLDDVTEKMKVFDVKKA